MKIRSEVISKAGRRTNNEDYSCIWAETLDDRWFGIICDGMGGHAMGETASRIVGNAMFGYWLDTKNIIDSEPKVMLACEDAFNRLREFSIMIRVPEMGTTMVMASIDKDVLTVGHLGDSRCYVQRPGEGVVYQTADHVSLSFGFEVVTKCFFSSNGHVPDPDVVQMKVKPGDRILLCSDGVYKCIPPDVLLGRMMDDKPLREILDVLDLMCEKYSDDNYTAILAEVME